MDVLTVKGKSGSSQIVLDASLDRLEEYVPDGRTFIVTDANVERLYGDRLPSDWPRIRIGLGESAKTPETVIDAIRQLIALEADRSVFIVGVGGGIVCDVTGFIASTFMRGVRFGFVSSTLLSQVDASVGGKNGVNVDGYKNIFGTFNQPKFVLCDTNMLATLPIEELRCGLAEILKHILIADVDMLPYLEENASRALAADQDVLRTLVAHSVRVKANVVNQDEREAGERRKLNFGHTFGHAIEKLGGLRHGEAVAIGTLFALRLSEHRNLIQSADVARIETLLKALGLPTTTNHPADEVLRTMRSDKKRSGADIHFVLLERLGKARVERMPLDELEEVARDIFME
ncbi:MAG: 3-dehydroquinate synthase [Lentisphaeria bacterium]|nr:3-dehydroquinate synthase [Lentisphaeria bacterium]